MPVNTEPLEATCATGAGAPPSTLHTTKLGRPSLFDHYTARVQAPDEQIAKMHRSRHQGVMGAGALHDVCSIPRAFWLLAVTKVLEQDTGKAPVVRDRLVRCETAGLHVILFWTHTHPHLLLQLSPDGTVKAAAGGSTTSTTAVSNPLLNALTLGAYKNRPKAASSAYTQIPLLQRKYWVSHHSGRLLCVAS